MTKTIGIADTGRDASQTEWPSTVSARRGSDHPYVAPSLSPNTSRNMPHATNSAPTTSMR